MENSHSASKPERNGNSSIVNQGSESPRLQRKRTAQLQMNEHVTSLENLRFGAIRGDLESVKESLNRGITVDQVLKGGWTALIYAASGGYADIVRFLLDKGANPNFHKDFFTPLMAACASRQKSEKKLVDCVRILIKCGAEVDVTERHNTSALMFACKEGHAEVVRELLDSSPDLNVQDSQGWSALFWAANKGNKQIVQLLVQAGADTKIKDLSGQTAYDLAIHKGNNEVANILAGNINYISSQNSEEEEAVEEKPKAISHTKTERSVIPKSSQNETNSDEDIAMLLTGLDLEHLIPLFASKTVKLEKFLHFTENDLKDLGVEYDGERKNILQAIHKFQSKNLEKKSVYVLKTDNSLSTSEASLVLRNTAKHLKILLSSMTHIHKKVKGNPISEDLKKEKEDSNSLALTAVTQSALNQSESLYNEIKYLHMYLKKLEGSDQILSADIIVEKNEPVSRRSGRIVTLLVAAGFIFVALWKTKVIQGTPQFKFL